MKFLLLSPKNRTVWNFRGDLVKSIIDAGYEVIVTGPDQTDVDMITALGARFIEIPINKTGTSAVGDLKYCKCLISLMKTEKPDVTLGYTIKPVVYGALAAKLAGVKRSYGMITGGGYTFTAKTAKAKVLGIIVKMLYRVGLACLKGIIFQNPDDLEEFTKKGLASKCKCSMVNGSGVNIETFAPQPYPEKIRFFMLSRLLKSKGVREYLRAAEIVKQQYPEIHFGLLGKYETNMQDAIPEAEVEKYITAGIVERYEETNDVLPYYRACSVYVLPSYREGTPRTVLEAMACGRPVITTDTNGCRDTVKNGETGYLVPTENAEAVADAMKKFIENPALIQQFGEASRAYCAEKFDVHKVNADMLRIMEIV